MFRARHIWCLERDDNIGTRSGAIVLDPDDSPLDAKDAERALTVVSGLQVRDLVVYVDRIGAEALPSESLAGFVVAQVETDGSGIIVHGDKILSKPGDWLTDRAVQLWTYLEELEPEIYKIFGLEAMGAYINKSLAIR